MYSEKRIFNIRDWIVFIIFTCLCGAVVGTITAAFQQITRFFVDVLWVRIPQFFNSINMFGIELNFYYVILGVVGGFFIGIWQHKYGDYPILLDGIIKDYKKNKNIPYNNLRVVFIAALMPLVFGGSVGPEAGLAGIVLMLFCWVRDKYKSYIFYVIENKERKKKIELLNLIRTPRNIFIGEKIKYGNSTYTIPKSKKRTVYISAAAGGIFAFRFVSDLMAQGRTPIARFETFSYTLNELLYFFPIAILGILSGIVFLLSKKFAIYVYKPLQDKKILRAIITGLILSMTGMFFPYTMFSGQDQMMDVVSNWQSWNVTMLFATGFIKMLLINCCVYGGWKGGSFFPCLFCATAIGYGLSAFIPAEQSFIILVYMASYTAMSLGHPIIIVTLCMLFAPAAAFVPIAGAAFLGGWINKKAFLKLLNQKE